MLKHDPENQNKTRERKEEEVVNPHVDHPRSSWFEEVLAEEMNTEASVTIKKKGQE